MGLGLGRKWPSAAHKYPSRRGLGTSEVGVTRAGAWISPRGQLPRGHLFEVYFKRCLILLNLEEGRRNPTQARRNSGFLNIYFLFLQASSFLPNSPNHALTKVSSPVGMILLTPRGKGQEMRTDTCR